jgi:hypothetical protein
VARKVLFIVEVGWKGIREVSLTVLKNNLSVNILIKGAVDKKVLEIITRPSDKYRVRSIPRWFFRIYLFFYLIGNKMTGGLRGVVVSKARTRDWVRGFWYNAKLLLETDTGYELR